MTWYLVSLVVVVAVVMFAAGFLLGAILTSRQYDRALDRRDQGRPWAGGE